MAERKKLGRGLESLLSAEAIDSLEGKGDLLMISLDKIKFNENQPRVRLKGMDELIQSVKDRGVLQPVLLVPRDDQYLLIAGERRVRAATEVGLKEVPARVVQIEDDRELMELSLIENIHREDLDSIELAMAYKQLMENHELTQLQLAEALGIDRSTIANTLRLLKLVPEVQELVVNGVLSEGHARTLVGLPEPEQLKAARDMIERNLTVREAEVETQTRKPRKSDIRSKPDVNPEIKALNDKLMQKFATKVDIQIPDSKGKGKIVIEYYSIEELNRILDMLG